MNPTELEVLGDGTDADCDARDALRRFLSVNFFSSATWTTTGTVTFPSNNMKVGASGAGASNAKRTFNLPRGTGYTGLMVDVDSAVGSACSVTVSTGPAGGPGTPTTVGLPAGSGTTWVPIGEVIVPHVLKSVQFDCPANSYATFDWFVVQNADEVLPPATEISIDWHDTRTPGGGWTTTVVRSDEDRFIYMGTDVGGLARFDGLNPGWETIFGTGEITFAEGGVMSVSDVLPELAGGSGLYALMGDVERGESNVHGGLWYSPDRGDTWVMVADSFNSVTWDDDGDGNADSPPVYAAEDDVAGYPLLSQCPDSEGSSDTLWVDSGGRHLQGDWFGPGEVLYIANADPDAIGVSVFDSVMGEACPLAHTGDALPAEPIGGILRVDVAPSGDPALLVGYDARPYGLPSLYICELPSSGMDCTGATSASCQVILGSDGIDVRDLQRDLRFEGTTVFVADGGYRPDDDNANGQLDACAVEEAGVWALDLNDAGVLSYTLDRVADAGDMPQLAVNSLSGISMDQGANYLFANVPRGPTDYYSIDRMYRIPIGDLALGNAWTAVNDEEDPQVAISLLDDREAVRQSNMDASATWLTESLLGAPAVFPARDAPGPGIDTTWIEPGMPFAAGLAFVSTRSHVWMVSGLDGTWSDGDADGVIDSEEETFWLFQPPVDPGERGTYQSMVPAEIAVSPSGEILQAVLDHGFIYLDASVPQSSATPNSSEEECLWRSGFNGGAASVDVGLDGSLWVALRDQTVTAAEPYPHDGGVLRFADMGSGASWTYAAGGYLDSTLTTYQFSMVADFERLCIDKEPLTNSAEAMDVNDPSPFSDGNPSIGAASFGIANEVRPLDATTAVVLFRPSSESGYSTDGGLYATLSGGDNDLLPAGTSAWQPIPFDGSYTVDTTSGTCDEATVLQYAHVQLIHPGVDTYANDISPVDGMVDDLDSDGYPDDFLLDLLVTVSANDTSTVSDSAGRKWSPCAVARVLVGDDGAGGLDATWEWIPIPRDYEGAPTFECGVWGRNLEGASVSPWSNEVFYWGRYYRDPVSPRYGAQRGGGACLLDLDSYGVSMLLNPGEYEYSIQDVLPHPQVTDFVAVLPTLDRETWLQCGHLRPAWLVDYPDICRYPWPLLAERQGSTWSVVELSTQPPTGLITDAEWSDLGITVGEDSESWLVVGTEGSGTWRGVLEW